MSKRKKTDDAGRAQLLGERRALDGSQPRALGERLDPVPVRLQVPQLGGVFRVPSAERFEVRRFPALQVELVLREQLLGLRQRARLGKGGVAHRFG